MRRAERRAQSEERVLRASASLFRRQGSSGTGLKELSKASATPLGSIYHFFPGGKEEITAAAVRHSGERYKALIDIAFRNGVVSGVEAFFRYAADALEKSDFGDGCPIASVAVDAAATNEPIRLACAEVFAGWRKRLTIYLAKEGWDAKKAERFSWFALAALEGAIILAKAEHSTKPLQASAAYVAGCASAL